MYMQTTTLQVVSLWWEVGTTKVYIEGSVGEIPTTALYMMLSRNS